MAIQKRSLLEYFFFNEVGALFSSNNQSQKKGKNKDNKGKKE
jgi:hypothetical protein